MDGVNLPADGDFEVVGELHAAVKSSSVQAALTELTAQLSASWLRYSSVTAEADRRPSEDDKSTSKV